MLLFSSCDSGMLIVDIEIGKFPDKIVYIANVDTELDIAGATIITHLKQGTTYEMDIADDDFCTFEYDVNFTKPGVYEIVVVRAGIRNKFPIQVVDIDELRASISGVS